MMQENWKAAERGETRNGRRCANSASARGGAGLRGVRCADLAESGGSLSAPPLRASPALGDLRGVRSGGCSIFQQSCQRRCGSRLGPFSVDLFWGWLTVGARFRPVSSLEAAQQRLNLGDGHAVEFLGVDGTFIGFAGFRRHQSCAIEHRARGVNTRPPWGLRVIDDRCQEDNRLARRGAERPLLLGLDRRLNGRIPDKAVSFLARAGRSVPCRTRRRRSIAAAAHVLSHKSRLHFA